MKPSTFAPLQRQFLGPCLRATLTNASSSQSSSSTITPLLRPLLSSSSSSAQPPASFTQRRFETTTARTKRALNVPPHLSFLSRDDPDRDVIIFNPPSAAPSVYNTPFKFLPRNDQRRYDGIDQLFQTRGGVEPDPAQLPLVDPVRGSWASRDGPKYDLTFEQAMEIRRLRKEDPHKWTIHKLAKKFNCAPRFVVMCAPASKEYRVEIDQKLDSVKKGWGQKKTKARMDKQKRKELLYGGLI